MAWMKAHLSAMFVSGSNALAAYAGSSSPLMNKSIFSFLVVRLFNSCRFSFSALHKPCPHLFPIMTVFPSFNMMHSVAEKCAVHPSSHSFPTEYREPEANVEKMCAFLARSLRCGRFNFAVCVDWDVMPFGFITFMGFFARCISCIFGSSFKPKCPVAPVSIMPVLFFVFGVTELTTVALGFKLQILLFTFTCKEFKFSFSAIPMSHLHVLSDPSILFSMVASSW